MNAALWNIFLQETDARREALTRAHAALAGGTAPAEEDMQRLRELRGAALLAGAGDCAKALEAFAANGCATPQERNFATEIIRVLLALPENKTPAEEAAKLFAQSARSAGDSTDNNADNFVGAASGNAPLPVTPKKNPAKQTSAQATADVAGRPAPLPANPQLDPQLQEMFAEEARQRIGEMTDSILALEKSPDNPALMEALMRAAHSLKGAARLTGHLSVQELAHEMEDYFVGAQKGAHKIGATEADLLLALTDALTELAAHRQDSAEPHLARLRTISGKAAASPKPETAAPSAPAQRMEKLLVTPVIPAAPVTFAAVNAPAQSASPSANTPGKPVTTPAPLPATATAPATPSVGAAQSGEQSVMRVSAAGMTRILGLAAETVVQARALQPITQELQQLKRELLAQEAQLESLRRQMPERDGLCRTLEEMKERATAQIRRVQRLSEGTQNCTRKSADLSGRLYREALGSRMRPFKEGVQGFYRLVRDLSRQLEKQVDFEILGLNTRVDRDVLARLESPLTHLIRNALDHGLQSTHERQLAGKPPANRLTLNAMHWAGFLNIRLSDDGRGIDPERIRAKVRERGLHPPESLPGLSQRELLEFLFLPGFSTAEKVTDISGRGVGLDAVRDTLRSLGGSVEIENRPGEGVTFHLRLPLTRSVARLLLIEVCGESFALPLSRIERLLKVKRGNIHLLQNRPYICDNGQNIGLLETGRLLGLSGGELPNDAETEIPVVVVRGSDNLYGLTAGAFLGEHELVIRPLDARLGKVRDLSAVVLREDGEIVLLLDIDDLVATQEESGLSGNSGADVPASAHLGAQTAPARAARILIVEDSPTVREMERRLLEGAGYAVETAPDGMEGWLRLRADDFTLLISDVDMPRMNGLELVRNLRAHPGLAQMPVLLVSYKDRAEDRQAALEAGADAYMCKGGFSDGEFMAHVRELCAQGRERGARG